MKYKDDRAMRVVCVFLLLPVIWFSALFAQAWDSAQGVAEFIALLPVALENPTRFYWTSYTLRFALAGAGIYAVSLMLYLSSRPRTRKGEEYGSAAWGNVHTICAKYRDKRFAQNRIFTQHFRMGFDSRRHKRNLSTILTGGSGAGKSRTYAIPNLLSAAHSFICTDPKGELLRTCGHALKKEGFAIKVIDLVEPSASMGYNPFDYIRTDADALKLINNLIKNTNPKNSNPSEPFWERAESALLQALILYLHHEAEPAFKNFGAVLELLRQEEVSDEGSEDIPSPLDIIFQRLSEKKPNHIACKQYAIYKQSSGRTASSILVSVGVRLSIWNIDEIARIFEKDELNLGDLGRKKTALFCIIPDSHDTFNSIVGMIYSSAITELYYIADKEYGGSLPVHVHFLMEEFASVALPDSFENFCSTARSRNMSYTISIQATVQIKARFPQVWESIIGNADTFLYLGGNEQSTHQYVSQLLGKGQLDTNTHSQTKGSRGSYSTNFQALGRELLTADELRLLDNRYAILFLRGEKPIYDLKYDMRTHPNYKLTPDGGHAPYEHRQ